MNKMLILILFSSMFSSLALGQIPPPEPCVDGTQPTCRCESAPVLCTIDDLDGYEFSMSDFQHPQDGPDEFCGDVTATADNPTWFSFVAWCETLELEVEIDNCSDVCLTGGPCNFFCNLLGNCSSGVQIAIFSDCSYQNVVACNVDECGNENRKTLFMNNLSIGNTYHFVIDGCGGSACDQVRVNVVGSCGSQQIEDWKSPIIGPDVVCIQESNIYTVDSLDGANHYMWFLDGVLLDSTDIPSFELEIMDTGSYELCVDVNNLPCVPLSNPPEAICTSIQVVSADLEGLRLDTNQTCPGDSILLNIIRSGNRDDWTSLLWIVDQDNQVRELSNTGSLVFSHDQCDSFTAFAIQFLDTNILQPQIGTEYTLPDCTHSCCAVFSEPFAFVDNEAPSFINPPEDAIYPCLAAVPDLPDLSYSDNCSLTGVVLGVETGRDRIIDTGTIIRTWVSSDVCSNETVYEQRIEIPNPEAFSLSINPTFAEAFLNELVRVEAVTSLDDSQISNIEWLPGFNVSCTECLITQIRALEDEIFTLVVTDTFGCEEETQFQLIIRKPEINIFIPNSFSPNGDGINDGFTIYSNAIFQEVELTIFNRWGSRLFYSKAVVPGDEATGWDGTFRGRPIDPGVYMYSFRIQYEDGTFEVIKGDLMVVP